MRGAWGALHLALHLALSLALRLEQYLFTRAPSDALSPLVHFERAAPEYSSHVPRTVLVPSPLLAHTCPTFVCRPPRSVFATQFKLFKASHVVTPKLYCTGLAKGEMTEEGSSKACGIEVRAGRPDFTDLLIQSKTESDRQTVKPLDGGFQVIGVYACGPKPMMKSVREAVQRASGSGVKFYLHEETYEL